VINMVFRFMLKMMHSTACCLLSLLLNNETQGIGSVISNKVLSPTWALNFQIKLREVMKGSYCRISISSGAPFAASTTVYARTAMYSLEAGLRVMLV
jgi:hypothetical protein